MIRDEKKAAPPKVAPPSSPCARLGQLNRSATGARDSLLSPQSITYLKRKKSRSAFPPTHFSPAVSLYTDRTTLTDSCVQRKKNRCRLLPHGRAARARCRPHVFRDGPLVRKPRVDIHIYFFLRNLSFELRCGVEYSAVCDYFRTIYSPETSTSARLPPFKSRGRDALALDRLGI